MTATLLCRAQNPAYFRPSSFFLVKSFSGFIISQNFSRKEVTLGLKIVINKGMTLDKALKQLKRKMATEGISKEIKKHSYYEKPSDRRRRKQKERLRAIRKAMKEKLMM